MAWVCISLHLFGARSEAVAVDPRSGRVIVGTQMRVDTGQSWRRGVLRKLSEPKVGGGRRRTLLEYWKPVGSNLTVTIKVPNGCRACIH